MSTKRPTLYVFTISHFCEKARWALDLAEIDYKFKTIAPGQHIRLSKKLGLPDRTVPMLQLPSGEVIQQSADIVDWAFAQKQHPLLSGDRSIESRIDACLGGPIAYYFYSETFLNDPDRLKGIFSSGLGFGSRIALRLLWRPLMKAMQKGMNLTAEQSAKSREALVTELDWLDSLLVDGNRYLGGDTPARHDLAAASLLAPLIQPPEHPSYGALDLPEKVKNDCDAWKSRPCLEMTRKLYQSHRSIRR